MFTNAHIDAVNRPRNVINLFDANFTIHLAPLKSPLGLVSKNTNNLLPDHPDVDAFMKYQFTFTDDQDTHTDSIWWDLGILDDELKTGDIKGPWAPWTKSVDKNLDMVNLIVAETKKRGLETFYSHRMNGATEWTPLKKENPNWLFKYSWIPDKDAGYWNYAFPEVRKHVLENLTGLINQYDFDGIQLDYARGLIFPAGTQWENRNELTDLMRSFRKITLEFEKNKNRPFLTAARVPENIVGCHFDGIDIEAWVREELVDILVLGCRSLDMDIHSFRNLTKGTNIKLYPSIDDHHACDGYHNPGIKVFRGLASNWYRDGADGIQSFNFNFAPNAPFGNEDSESHLQFYKECHSPKALIGKDKTFIVQRRGGGHGPSVIPNAEDWYTPRHSYANTSMLSSLPAAINNDGKVDTLLTINVADEIKPDNENLKEVTIRLLLSDKSAQILPDSERLDTVIVATWGHINRRLDNIPAAKGIENHIQIRLNNSLLEKPVLSKGWIIFRVEPSQLSVGANLVGINIRDRDSKSEFNVEIEKLELHVNYI